ncbi:glutamine synthetase [Candidatus Thorarchaeota archaeon]|nr:MAG: glutamine synthetase [Candidatus Thorarchaeota archaeon]
MSEKIENVELRFTDILGRMKAMIVPCNPVDDLKALAADPILKKGTSCDGSSVTGLANVEASDLRLDPDFSTLIEIPFLGRRTAAAMCYVRKKESTSATEYYPLDTRGRLQSVYDEYLSGKMQLKVKVEPEFHFITPEGQPFDDAGYADSYPRSPGVDILLSISAAIREIGIKPRVIHHEVGEAQQEIELDFEDARKMADYILIFKSFTRSIAQENGIDVTFMPKPFAGEAGSGLHCHLQLWEGDKNLFGDTETGGLSETAKQFIAGLLEHAPAITAIANPSVNSYKRLVPHHEAPVYITWGEMNRTVLVRIPMFGSSEKAAVEFRSGDAMANPYLLFSAIIAAGKDGINRKLVPPEPRSEDIFAMSDEDRAKHGIKMLPSSLKEALDYLEDDSVILDAIGPDIARNYIKLKRDEWNKYSNHIVTEWEWEEYQDL